MSGIEIAGLVLGALPLLIEALKKGQEGWTAFRKIRVQLDDLINCLKEQKWMFKSSTKILLSAAGQDLSGDSEPSALLADAETRNQLEEYLENDADTLAVFDRIMADYKASLTAIIGKLEHIGPFSLEAKSIQAATAKKADNGGFPFDKRLKFTMKRSEMKEEISNLDRCNARFKSLTDRVQELNRNQVRDLTKEEAAKRLARELHDIRHRAIGLHTAMESSWDKKCQPSHTTMLILESRTTFGKVQNRNRNDDASFHCLLACGDPGHRCNEAFFSFDSKTTAAGKQAIADLCSHLIHPVQGKATALSIDAQYKLFAAMAEQKAHFDLAKGSETVTLEQLLMQHARLSPQHKTQLALDIASSLLQLQTTRWLEKSWTSKVIHFMRHHFGGKQIVDYQKPFITRSFPSIGPGHGDDHVKDDLLELGILLLEVWNLQTFEDWAASSGIALRAGYYARMAPAAQWLEESESEFMLPSYSDAVSVCVKFSFEGVPHRWDHPEFRRAFCEKVLSKLQENHKAWVRA
ncbi:uncharacterized protein AB675_1756 [Cyphellophora attinorum]|uniref:DUF7580 domain-containing protein n=1 Tax=Cyphellophora attinorum TaxID=1664694 RepID=A0A0N1P0B1_9EURO|nr:uncharacterized protein AB675_1756 [Phialophora attinorum]KPI42994.1 hypothetical protein AB675_1756 [Phialophora attinorum]